MQLSLWHQDSEENVGVKERSETSGRLPELSSGTPPVCSGATLQRCRQTRELLSGVLLIKEANTEMKAGLGQHRCDGTLQHCHHSVALGG